MGYVKRIVPQGNTTSNFRKENASENLQERMWDRIRNPRAAHGNSVRTHHALTSARSRTERRGRDGDQLLESIPILDEFAEAVRPENYRPLPDDWVVGFSDVIGSTEAVANGRYKAVNMVGAGVIAAVANALERRPFPFVFGGDGASFAVSASRRPGRGRRTRLDGRFRP